MMGRGLAAAMLFTAGAASAQPAAEGPVGPGFRQFERICIQTEADPALVDQSARAGGLKEGPARDGLRTWRSADQALTVTTQAELRPKVKPVGDVRISGCTLTLSHYAPEDVDGFWQWLRRPPRFRTAPPFGAFIVVKEMNSPREVAGNTPDFTRRAMKWGDLRLVNMQQVPGGLRLFYGVVQSAKAP